MTGTTRFTDAEAETQRGDETPPIPQTSSSPSEGSGQRPLHGTRLPPVGPDRYSTHRRSTDRSLEKLIPSPGLSASQLRKESAGDGAHFIWALPL